MLQYIYFPLVLWSSLDLFKYKICLPLAVIYSRFINVTVLYFTFDFLIDYCPEYNTGANTLDTVPCNVSTGSCPDALFMSNEVYKCMSHSHFSCLSFFNELKEKTVSVWLHNSIVFAETEVCHPNIFNGKSNHEIPNLCIWVYSRVLLIYECICIV